MTPSEALPPAEWMLEEFLRSKYLSQEEAVSHIASDWGEPWVYYNESGNLAIDRKVLDQFKLLSGPDVVWSRSDFAWRPREDGDEPGRSQY